MGRAHPALIAAAGVAVVFITMVTSAGAAGPAPQLSQASGRVFCPGASSRTDSSTVQSCTFSAQNAVCFQRSTNPDVMQTCIFRQSGTTRAVRAIAVQVIEQRGPGSGTQTGKQVIDAEQGNGTGSNAVWATQIVKQFLGRGADERDGEESQQAREESSAEVQNRPGNFATLLTQLWSGENAREGDEPSEAAALGGPISQDQQSQQNIRICQGAVANCQTAAGMTGSNLVSVYQSLRQRERGANAVSIAQDQNKLQGNCPESARTDPNMCTVVDQNTTGGTNKSGVFELYRQFQSARHTLSGHQLQDPSVADTGGLEHDVHQTSHGPLSGPRRNSIVTDQRARQTQRVFDAGTLTQAQDPRVDKTPGSFQVGSSADTWNGKQLAEQLQSRDGMLTPAGGQHQLLTYDADSTGHVQVTQTGTQNGSTTSRQCPDPAAPPGSDKSCHVAVACASGSCSAVPSGGDSVVGSGTLNGCIQNGPCYTNAPFSVSAYANPAGTQASGTYTFGTSHHGTVMCVNAVQNKASVGGIMDSGPAVGDSFVVYFVDNGPPQNGASPDLATPLDISPTGMPAGFPQTCPSADSPFGYLSVGSGDVVVHDGGP